VSAREAGTFTTGSAAGAGATSAVCVIPSGRNTMRVILSGLNASNTVKTRKRVVSGPFVDQTTYSSDQNVDVAVSPGEEWQLVQVTQQPIRDVRYVLNAV
jgi:hypothetical protein